MESAFVTGAAGFVGSHLVDRLLALGQRVVGVDNFVLGKKENLAKASVHPNFTFAEVDVNDLKSIGNVLKSTGFAKNGTVWHLAANSDIQAGTRDPDVDLRLTFLTTY